MQQGSISPSFRPFICLQGRGYQWEASSPPSISRSALAATSGLTFRLSAPQLIHRLRTAGGSALGFARGLLVDRHMLANAMILATLSSCNPPRSDAFSQPSFISLANTKIRTEYL